MDNDCIFCKIIKKEIPAKVVFENEYVIAFNDINPVADIHLLVIPKKHIETLNDLENEDIPLVGKIFMAIKELARQRGIYSNGYRVIANCNKDAGQDVFHLHFHLIGGRKLTWPPG